MVNRTTRWEFSRASLVCVLVLVLTTTSVAAVSWHHHNSSASEATCQICHFAHLRSIKPPAQVRLLEPSLLHRVILDDAHWTYAGPSAFSISPRAPPLE
ncbi:MAG: hypothetical protein WA876_16815 [Candidatus Acidiferrales bacterium]